MLADIFRLSATDYYPGCVGFYVQGGGRQLNDELVAAKALAKAQKEGVREHAANVNSLKKLIDELQVGQEEESVHDVLQSSMLVSPLRCREGQEAPKRTVRTSLCRPRCLHLPRTPLVNVMTTLS